HRRTAIAVEMTQRPQIAFLHRVLGVGDVAHQVMRKREEVVEMRQRGVAKTPRPVLLVMSITRHRIALGRPKFCRRWLLQPIEHYCTALPPAAGSTTIVPVICG